jgi:hypothetical protein
MRQHAGLAGARAREDEKRPVSVCDRVALGRVEMGEQPLLGRRASLDGRPELLLVLGYGHGSRIATTHD